MANADGSVTEWLHRLHKGDERAGDALMELLYQDLYKIAQNRMRRERGSHTLQPTALVNEAYLRLVQTPDRTWQNRAHFLAAASKAMRRLLIDHARKRNAGIHGGGFIRVPLDDRIVGANYTPEVLLTIDNALSKLQALDPELAQVVEYRFFGGLTHDEVASLLGVSSKTVKRRWETAQTWIKAEMNGQTGVSED